MADEQIEKPEGYLPLQIPPSHLRIIMSALGELPNKVAGPTVNLISAQIENLKAMQAAAHAAKLAAEGEADKPSVQDVGAAVARNRKPRR